MNTYTPNWNNRAFKKRAHKAILFCDTYLMNNKPKWLSIKWIYHSDNFGSNRQASSRYLKELLLVCVNDKYRRGIREDKRDSQCKQYIVSDSGMRYLREKLGMAVEPIIDNNQTNTNKLYCCVDFHPLFDTYQDQLATGQFKTTTKSHREYHQLVNLPSLIKNRDFPRMGFAYNSDIECASVTLLYQHSKKCGLRKTLPAIEYYIKNRTLVRERICRLLSFTTPQEKQLVKRLIAGLVNGQYITTRYDSQIVKDFDGRYPLIELLKQDLFLQRFRQELSDMWRAIKPYHTKSTGRMTCRQKSMIYFQLEEQVRLSVKRFMSQRGIHMFPEHDGWRTNEIYDIDQLKVFVRRETGFIIKIAWEVLSVD